MLTLVSAIENAKVEQNEGRGVAWWSRWRARYSIQLVVSKDSIEKVQSEEGQEGGEGIS